MTASRDRRFTQIGIDRLVRLEWLEKTASLVLAHNDPAAISSILRADLNDYFQTEESTVRGSIDKSITVLLKVWIRVPADLKPLRNSGLDLLREVRRNDRLAVHWGMIMAGYPFWAAVALQVGRLLRLQGTVVAAQVQRRIREQYGERETVSRRVRYVLRSYVDWGVLSETRENGVYSEGLSVGIENPRLIAWLVEALLHTRSSGSAPFKELIDSPCLFPFRFKPVHADGLLALSPRIELLRHGLNNDLVVLARQPVNGD
jgi:hypothetical protein